MFTDALTLTVLLFVPAIAVVVGSLALGWLEERQDLPGRVPAVRRDTADDDVLTDRSSLLWAVPYAALSAALILAPIVTVVWALAADAPSVGYIATVGFGVGALAVRQLATSSGFTARLPWTHAPGVMLSAAVGFVVALVAFLGAEAADFAGFDAYGASGVVAAIGVATLLGGLGVVVWRQRR